MSAPLEGIRVVVTRSRRQAARLATLLKQAGARIELLPLLEILPPADREALRRAARAPAVQWIAFTSRNAVEAFGAARSSPLPDEIKIAVVGGATAEAARRHRLKPDVVARDARAEGLLSALEGRVRAGDHILLPQAADARPQLGDGLEARGLVVERVVAYDKRRPPEAAERSRELFAAEPLGWITFTSPSTVRELVELLAEEWESRRDELLAASIGPTTSAELHRRGVVPAAEAAEASAEGLVAAIVAAVRAGRR